MLLPVWHGKDRIIEAWKNEEVLIIIGETGSGKTTQIPQFILEASSTSTIAITQPRRLSAVSIAARVAQEVGCSLGTQVGYSIRLENVTSKETRVKFLTDGTLLQEMLGDPLLEEYDTIIIDEAHERSLRSDILLGFLKTIQSSSLRNRPLKFIIMSATLDAELFLDFFERKAKVLHVQGRTHEVKVNYLKSSTTDYLEAAISAIFHIHLELPPGDVLMNVLPLYANLSHTEQARVFVRTHERKVILSTNIAETGVTVPGIKYVVDPGLAKVKLLDAGSGREVSTAKAPGVAYRLYPESTFKALDLNTPPEIKRIGLDHAMLHMLATGVKDVSTFSYLDPPDSVSLSYALRRLQFLGAVKPTKSQEEPYQLTELGTRMAGLPLSPTLSRNGCAADIISLVCLLEHYEKIWSSSSNSQLAERKRAFMHREGDHLTFLNVLRAFEELKQEGGERKRWCQENGVNWRTMVKVLESRRQLVDRCRRLKLGDTEASVLKGRSEDPAAVDTVLKTCTVGYIYNVGIKHDDGFRSTVSKTTFKIHPGSALHNRPAVKAVIYNELLHTSQLYARVVSRVQPAWILEAQKGELHVSLSATSTSA
ncbi:P-loop containing nucleoside triphosphate hydrolase protein [Atractiella rhizophila]|nr:P-loop containing nucleoside triphosphate hydrolase protein [Atractiella rhizophila]